MLLKVLQMISPQDYYNKNQVTNFNVLVAYLWGCRPSLFCSSEKCFMFIHHPSSTCKEKKMSTGINMLLFKYSNQCQFLQCNWVFLDIWLYKLGASIYFSVAQYSLFTLFSFEMFVNQFHNAWQVLPNPFKPIMYKSLFLLILTNSKVKVLSQNV